MSKPTRLRPIAAFAVLACVAAVGPSSVAEASGPSVESSVVRIVSQSNPPDLTAPWQRLGSEPVLGTGVILEGNRILTNAHVVEDTVGIEVKRAGTGESFAAEVAAVAHECDLALLSVADERFFHEARALAIGAMPQVRESVRVYGFPVGGETVAVTSGIVSRIEFDTYVYSMEELLLAQIDAAIQPGNSGGPVVAGDALVGIALQKLEDADNVGYMVPVPVIRHFLDDVTDGRYDGFPRLGIRFQVLGSETHRASLAMDDRQSGVLVAKIDHGSPASRLVREGDVLMQVDDLPVANDGTVARPGIGRVGLLHLVRSKQIGETLSLSLLRGGRPVEGTITLDPHQTLVPGRRVAEAPQYLVFGGLVFQPLTLEYLRYFEEIPADLSYHGLLQSIVTPERSQWILIQRVLPNAVNRGYQGIEDYLVQSVDGQVPRDMRDLTRILDGARGKWIEIVTDDGTRVVLDLAGVRETQATLLAGFGIAHDRSPDLRE